jgi:hypothetical protein
MIWRNKSKKLVKFLLYREDINQIVYEYNNQLFQEHSSLFREATYDEIFNYYKRIIDSKKDKIRSLKLYYKRPNRKQLIEQMKEINIAIKEFEFKIENLLIMNKLTNSNNLNLSSPKSKVTNLKKKKKHLVLNYNIDNNNYKQQKKKKKDIKLKIGDLKTERNKILANLLIIKGCEQ